MTYDLLQQVCVYCLHCLTCALPVCHISVVITVGIVLNVLFFYYFRGPSTHGFIDPSAYPSIVINRQSRELYREVSSRPLIRSYCWTLRFAAQNRNIQAGWISWYDKNGVRSGIATLLDWQAELFELGGPPDRRWTFLVIPGTPGFLPSSLPAGGDRSRMNRSTQDSLLIPGWTSSASFHQQARIFPMCKEGLRGGRPVLIESSLYTV